MTIYELSAKHGDSIKKAVQELTGFDAKSLFVQCNLKEGVYLSDDFPDTLCTLVTSSVNGRCYVVSSKILGDDELSEFIALAI